MLHDLFWALYWIDVLSNIPVNLAVGLVIGGIGAGLALVLLLMATDETYESTERRAKLRAMRKAGIPWIVRSAGAFLLVMVLMSFFPSKNTMYLMLGTRGVEHAVNSETGKKIQLLIDKKLIELIGAVKK